MFQSEPWGFRTSRTLDEPIRSIVEKFARDRFCFLVDTLFPCRPVGSAPDKPGSEACLSDGHASSPRATGSSGWSRLGAGFRRPPRRFHGRVFLPMVEELQDGPGLVADQALRGASEDGAVDRLRWGCREHGYGRRATGGARRNRTRRLRAIVTTRLSKLSSGLGPVFSPAFGGGSTHGRAHGSRANGPLHSRSRIVSARSIRSAGFEPAAGQIKARVFVLVACSPRQQCRQRLSCCAGWIELSA